MRLIPKTSVGVEVAGEDLRIGVLRTLGGKRRLVRLDVLTGFTALTEEDRVATLAAHFKQHRLSGLNIQLTLPSAWGVSRDLEFPPSVGTSDALRSAVALQIENLSPWTQDEVYWDCSSEPPAKGLRSIVVHVGIVPRAVLDPWIALFRSARLALTGASLSSFSWAHGLNVLWGAERPAMILAAESRYVEGALIRDGRVYSASAPGDEPAQLVTAAASQLMRTARVDSPERLRFVGYGSAVAVAELESAPIPVEGAAPGRPAFGAVAAALLGVARSGFQMNLIPAPLRFQRNYLQVAPTYGLLLLLGALGLFAFLREPYQQSLYAGQLDNEARRLAVEVRPVADQEARLNAISDRLKILDGLIRGRDANLEAMRELSRVLPPGTWLTAFGYQDNVVTVGGLSDSAASIQKLLEDSPVFRDAQFTSSITRDVSGTDRFSLRASIEVRP
jgi:Tfp pilus assembly protein PilN